MTSKTESPTAQINWRQALDEIELGLAIAIAPYLLAWLYGAAS